ncbi:hypothetical protein [Paenibacillus sp. FSL L8-0709]|uniref:hypothetical protein n=1 Tax=Paenibacillus sp. FSL L8-0709 TaxID=2975312 RepID=UPI0030FC2BB3
MIDFGLIIVAASQVKDKNEQETFLHILPDPENEFENVIEIKVPQSYEIKEKWIDIIANAYVEYYKNSEVYDNQDIGPIELVLNAIKIHDIPIVRYWGSAQVEKLNVRWLNRNSL